MGMQVFCSTCGWVDVEDVDFVDIEEGPQGEDRMEFVCHECGETHESAVYGRR